MMLKPKKMFTQTTFHSSKHHFQRGDNNIIVEVDSGKGQQDGSPPFT